jgi:hypothetical protein
MRLGLTSSVGWKTFAFSLDKLGGLKRLARTNYMRNLWAVMKEFNVLPTSEDFRALSDSQIDMIIYSMIEDNRQMELARRGVKEDGNYFDDAFEEEVWNKAPGEWDVLKEGHDPDDIARQIEELTKEEDRRNLMSKFDSLDEYNAFRAAGGQTSRESEISDYIDRQIKAAQEKARMLSSGAVSSEKVLVDDNALAREKSAEPGLNKKAMEDAIKLFTSDDDDFDVL